MRGAFVLGLIVGWCTAGQLQENAWYAAAAFCNASLPDWGCKPCLRTPATRLVTILDNEKYETHGYVALSPATKRIVLSFRGTAGPIGELIGHSMALVPFRDASNSSVQVHYGFYTGMLSLEDQFIPSIRTLLADRRTQNYTVTVTGHSLGGALATLAAAHLITALPLDAGRIELFTYGQPQTGTEGFVAWFNSLGIRTARVANLRDDVPHLFDKYNLRYSHVGREIQVDGPSVAVCDATCPAVPPDQLRPADHLHIFDTIFGDSC